MSDKDKKFKWLDKIKNIKHIEIYIAIVFVVVLALIYLSTSGKTSTKANSTTQTNELSVTAYVSQLETNLENILSNIGGVTDVKVMITLNMSQAEVNNSQIYINKFPEIKGVVVTAKGVNDTDKKLKVLHAIEAVMEIKSGRIEILSSD